MQRETAHLRAVFERLIEDDVRDAFFELVHRLHSEFEITFRFLSRGNFSAVHLLFDPDGSSYGDAQFGFKGARDHMRWWFHPPCLKNGLLKQEEILEQLPLAEDRGDHHLIADIRNNTDVDKILYLVGLAKQRYRPAF